MHKDLIETLDPSVTAAAVKLWAGDPSTLQLLGQSQNFVYCFSGNASERRVLRISHASHRQFEDLDAELEFVTYLKSQGCDVAGAIPSSNGDLIEALGAQSSDEPAEFHATAFEFVPGEKFKWGRDEQNRKTLALLGRWLGKMHTLSQAYQPTRSLRFSWFEDDLYTKAETYLPESEPGLRKEMADLIYWINRHPASRENYGLVHGDMWGTNFRQVGDRIIAYDFDDCCQHWYMYDLAVTIAAARKLPEKYRMPYLKCLLDGYAEHRPVAGDVRTEIDWLSRLAALHRYANTIRSVDLENPSERAKALLAERKQEVLEPIRWA